MMQETEKKFATLQEYVDFISQEVKMLEDGRFIGNVEFQLNFFDGKINNMNCVLRKSVKL